MSLIPETSASTCPYASLMQVAVRNIIFNGTVHLVLSPLLNTLPVVGAIQVSANAWSTSQMKSISSEALQCFGRTSMHLPYIAGHGVLVSV